MAFRNSTTISLRFTDNDSNSGYFNFEKFAGGILEAEQAGSIIWCVGTRANPVPLRNATGLVATTTHVGHAIALPEELFGAGFVMGLVAPGQPPINVRISLKS